MMASDQERTALVVEDHPLFNEALVNTVLRAGLGLQCRAVTSAAAARRALISPGAFVLALVDQRLPDGEGISLLGEMAAGVPVRVLISGLEDPGLLHRARSSGIQGFLPKSLSPQHMVLALRQVLRGEPWFPASRLPPPPPLTERQLQVLRLVGRGCPNREIASRLGIGERTVKDHLSIIFVRLGAGNRAEAVAQAGALGLVHFDGAE